MKYIGWALWGAITGVNMLLLLLIVTMMFNWYGVFWMVWDATSSVWYFAAGGAIINLSLSRRILKPTNKKALALTRNFSTVVDTDTVALAPLICQGNKRG